MPMVLVNNSQNIDHFIDFFKFNEKIIFSAGKVYTDDNFASRLSGKNIQDDKCLDVPHKMMKVLTGRNAP